MSDTKLVMPEQGTGRGKLRALESSHAWALLGWVGLTFLVVGGWDFALTWYPMDFGNREWQFGTVTASFNGLPVPVMGLGLLLASSIQTGRQWLAGVGALGALVLLVWALGGVVLWLGTVPLALEGTPVEVLVGMKKAIAKTAIQSVAYPMILGFLGWRGIQGFRGNIGSGREA